MVVAIDCAATTTELTVRLKVAVAVALLVSVTVTVYVVAELFTLGVPVIAPVPEAIESPAGSVGVTLYASAPVPPEPATGMKLVAWFTVSVVEAMAVVATTAEFTVRPKVAVAVALFASVTVTVYVAAEPATLGVPVTTPVPEAIDKPAGKDGETL